jgi:putative FmdB family regulatory protein
MPIFEYKCEKCGHNCEKIVHNVGISGALKWIRCPKCAAKMHKQVTAHAKTAAKWLV